MNFWLVNVTFYNALSIIHDVITTANPFPYTAKLIVSVLEITKLDKLDVER